MSFSRVIRNQRSFGNVVVPIDGASGLDEQVRSSSLHGGEAVELRLSQARMEASQVVEQARSAAEDIRRRAYDEGYRDGREQGLQNATEECQSQLDQAVQRATELIHTAQAQRSALIGSLGDLLTELVMTAVDSLLHRPDMVARADVAELVEKLLAEEVRSADVEVRVHPDDYADVASRCKLRFDGTTERVTVVPDNTLTRGGCVVVTGTEEIDASLATGMELLVPIVKRAVGRVLDERTIGVFSGV